MAGIATNEWLSVACVIGYRPSVFWIAMYPTDTYQDDCSLYDDVSDIRISRENTSPFVNPVSEIPQKIQIESYGDGEFMLVALYHSSGTSIGIVSRQMKVKFVSNTAQNLSFNDKGVDFLDSIQEGELIYQAQVKLVLFKGKWIEEKSWKTPKKEVVTWEDKTSQKEYFN